jgi:hypothetical protein
MGNIDMGKIHDELLQIKVINTHEHLWDETWRLKNKGDWTRLFHHYGITSLKMAGMSGIEAEKLYSPDSPHKKKWEIFSKYFNLAKNTAYIKAPIIAIRDIYGINEINIDSMEELTNKIEKMVKPGFYREILREKASIDYSMINCFDQDEKNNRYPLRLWGDLEIMKPDLFADSFIYPSGKDLIENETNIKCDDLDNWQKAIDIYFEKYAKYCCSIKIGLAYKGRLNFSPSVSLKRAEECFQQHKRGQLKTYKEARFLVDYLFYYIVNKAKEYKLPLKFHTGLYSGANSVNFDAVSKNVRDISNLAMSNPECKFIAMHIAYPYQDELVMAIRQISNLYADMSWSWIVDTGASCDFLKKALTAAPFTKVTGFGGDYSIPENTYGHLCIARKAMAGALSELVECGYFDVQEAIIAGSYLLRGSALKIYDKIC